MSTTTRPSVRRNTPDLSADRLERLYAYMDALVESGNLPGACVLVGRGGQACRPRVRQAAPGRRDDRPVEPDTIFLVASITKPVTVAAAMLLVERGQLLFDDRVSAYVPEFGNNGKEEIRIRHLMTHTSGLPDFLPENVELRRQHAPLDEFVRRICDLTPDFRAGHGRTVSEYRPGHARRGGGAHQRCVPAGIPASASSSCRWAWPTRRWACAIWINERIAFVDVPEEMRGEDWGWNTPYWWNLAVPWGGMFTTAHDLFRFFQMFLNGGEYARRARAQPSNRGGDDAQPARSAAGLAGVRPAQRTLGAGLGPWQAGAPVRAGPTSATSSHRPRSGTAAPPARWRGRTRRGSWCASSSPHSRAPCRWARCRDVRTWRRPPRFDHALVRRGDSRR